MPTSLHFRAPPPAPHPQFHDRVRFVDQPFSADAQKWAQDFRQRDAACNRAWCMDLWPAARPARALFGQGAFRTPLRANAKLVLLALIASADQSGVSMFHVRRMAHFVGMKTVELRDALNNLGDPEHGMVMSWTSDIDDWAQEGVTLVMRPENWRTSQPFPFPPFQGQPLHVVSGHPPRGLVMQSAMRDSIASLAKAKSAR
jgi:hypothetical protein